MFLCLRPSSHTNKGGAFKLSWFIRGDRKPTMEEILLSWSSLMRLWDDWWLFVFSNHMHLCTKIIIYFLFQGDKIHCTCKRTYIQRTQRDMRLGEWHMIDVFSLSNATGQYRTTNHTYKMSIIEDTKISKSSLVCDDKFFSFAGFEEIGNGTLKTHFLIG